MYELSRAGWVDGVGQILSLILWMQIKLWHAFNINFFFQKSIENGRGLNITGWNLEKEVKSFGDARSAGPGDAWYKQWCS